MILKIIRPILLLILCMGVFNVLTVRAQDDDRSFVFEAFARSDEGYHFTFEVNTTQTADYADEPSLITDTRVSGEGDANTEGDLQFRAEIQASTNQPDIPAIPSFEIERIDLDEETYIHLLADDPEIVELLASSDLAPGWYPLSSTEDPDYFFLGLKASTQFTRLPDFEIGSSTTETLVEIAPETIDGIEMRVFDLEMDVLTIAAQAALRNPDNQSVDVILDNAALLTQSDLSLTYHIWIGADDGLPYQITSEYNAEIPYLSAEEGRYPYRPPFDLITHASALYTFSQHGESVSITAPDAELLNN